jgi:hypothetical protein
MTTDTTDSTATSDAPGEYRRAVLVLRLLKLALGTLVALLTALELIG